MADLAGRELGQYVVVDRIGAGGMGEVYRARDSRLERDIALKVLPAELASDPDRAARFEREARALASLSHPNIVTIFSVEQLADRRFITMELVDGTLLDRAIPPGGLSLHRLPAMAVPLADRSQPPTKGESRTGTSSPQTSSSGRMGGR